MTGVHLPTADADAGRQHRVSDPAADRVSAVFHEHAARLVRLAVLLGADDPEDVVQESFFKLYVAAGSGRLGDDEGRTVGYLNRIVVNQVRSRHRHLRVVRRDAHLFHADEHHDPTARLDDRSAVVQALATLPPRQREALVLRFWMDLPLGTIAEVMGVRTGTVKSQISRGLAVVGQHLGQEVDR